MSLSKLNNENLQGVQKAAIMMLAMGEEFTATVFKKLDEDTIKEIGMVRITINVALHLPRKNSTTRITAIPAYIKLPVRLSIESTIYSEESKKVMISISSGRVSMSDGIKA